MWWFAAMHANLLLFHRMAAVATTSPMLDAGCGTGGLLARLAAAYPQRAVLGFDADHYACVRAQTKSGRPVCVASVNAMPFAGAAFGAIFSADVLCHAGVDERLALAQFHHSLNEQGVLVLNLPAYPWMMSGHDAAVDNVRRYTRAGVARLLRAAGFRLLFASYWNTLLFPIMIITRKLLPAGYAVSSDVRPYSAPVEALCRAAASLERVLLRHRVSLPFGGSLIAVAAKEALPTERSKVAGNA